MLNKITLPQSTEIFPLDVKYQNSSLDRDSIGNLHIPLKLSIRGREGGDNEQRFVYLWILECASRSCSRDSQQFRRTEINESARRSQRIIQGCWGRETSVPKGRQSDKH